MATAKKQKQKQKLNFLKLSYILNAVLLLTVIVLLFAVYKGLQPNEVTGKVTKPQIDVSLGAMRYDFKDGKAYKRDDAVVRSLQSFLTKTAQKDIQLGCHRTMYHVIRHNAARTQVLLNYGCETGGARMFAVQDTAGWKLVSPTNQFDDLGVPSCDHANKNGISAEIAPVCLNGLGKPADQQQYVDR